MKKQSIPAAMAEKIDKIQWSSKTVNDKAHRVMCVIFNRYSRENIDFCEHLNLADNYFRKIIPGKTDHIREVKSKLIAGGILIDHKSYNVFTGLGKSFSINLDLLSSAVPPLKADINDHALSSSPLFKGVVQSCISYCRPLDADKAQQDIQEQSFLPFLNRLIVRHTSHKSPITLQDKISEITKFKDKHLRIGEAITSTYLYLKFPGSKKKYRFKRETAFNKAAELNQLLIQYKGNSYFTDSVEQFRLSKEFNSRIKCQQKIFNLQNACFYEGRNNNNNRLDYNLTSLNKELFDFLAFDGEPLVELDIANAQYAIAAHINVNADSNFIDAAQNGLLYEYIGNKLKITCGEAKGLMFRVSFDKVKSDLEFDQIRNLFPKLMAWIDSYKKANGYKKFSNLLQRNESKLMIDGLFMFLISKRYEVFPIHDAIRVKQSQEQEVKALCIEYFKSVGFKCLLRDKNTNTHLLKRNPQEIRKSCPRKSFRHF